MTKQRLEERQKLTLEDYILFFTTRVGYGLNIDQLNQIIFMHGFIRLHRHNKHVIVDALNSVDLMRPRRSTLGSAALGPSPQAAAGAVAAALSVEEVKRDIEDLGWRECPVGSVLSVGAGGFTATAAIASDVPLAIIPAGAADCVSPSSRLSASSPVAATAPGKRKGKGSEKAVKRRKKRVAALLTLPSLEMTTSA